MDRFQNKYRIPSVRAHWHGYDGGVYFVTICTQNREHYFGSIVRNCSDGAHTTSTPLMQLSQIGQYAREQFVNVKMRYPYAEIPLFVVMPNHIHAIVVIGGENETVYGCGDGAYTASTGNSRKSDIVNSQMQTISKCKGLLSVVVGGVKSSITRFANQNNISFAWQARFHDRIVRDQNELNRISEYIENNVADWQTGNLY